MGLLGRGRHSAINNIIQQTCLKLFKLIGVQKTRSLGKMVGACSQNAVESPPCRFQATDALALTLGTTTSRLSVVTSSYLARCACAWKDGAVSETIARSATSSPTAAVPMPLLAPGVQIIARHKEAVQSQHPSANVPMAALWFTMELHVDVVNFGPSAIKGV